MRQGFLSYLIFFSIVYLGANGYLDLKMTQFDQAWILWALPSVPMLMRLTMLLCFAEYWFEVLSEEERDCESGRVLSLTLCGFSVSAFFVLIATNPTFVDNNIDIELSTYFMLISSVGLFGAFSVEAYKHRRWQQQLCLGLEEAGRFSLLASIAALMWASQFSDRLKFSVLAICAVIWTVDFLHRLNMWIEHLSNKRRYEIGDK